MTAIKNFLAYLTFCILLILCYIEKENARLFRARTVAVRQAGVVPVDRKDAMPYLARISEPDKQPSRLYMRAGYGASE